MSKKRGRHFPDSELVHVAKCRRIAISQGFNPTHWYVKGNLTASVAEKDGKSYHLSFDQDLQFWVSTYSVPKSVTDKILGL